MFVGSNGKFNPALTVENQKESKINRNTRIFFSETTRTQAPVRHKRPEANLKLYYKRTFEIAFCAYVDFVNRGVSDS